MKKNNYILVCDDNEFILQVTTFSLEAEGYTVETAKNTDEIFQKLDGKGVPSLIFMDLNIPEAGGEYVIKEIRKSETTKNIPIVIFSGQDNLEEIARNLSVDGFLPKPYTNDDLKKIVNKFLQK